jgi:hypothetical protein
MNGFSAFITIVGIILAIFLMLEHFTQTANRHREAEVRANYIKQVTTPQQ